MNDYYVKTTLDIGADVCFDDYFEVGRDGVLLRVVSHVAGRWWASACQDGDLDELHFGDIEPASAITVDEFERVWRLALGEFDAVRV